MPSSAPPKLFPRARPSKVKLLRRPLDATRPRLGGDETPVRAQILEGKWPPRDRNSRWVALRGCCRRCRRRLSGILPSRGAKAELRFWRALSAANMRTIAHTLLLLVVLLQFGAVIPPVCATREREEQGPLQEGDARERRIQSQRSGKWSGSGRARKRGDIAEHIGAR